jgi:enoyl-CoA hydratase
MIMAYETLIVETQDAVGIIRLNRPRALNALNSQLLNELGAALAAFEADDRIGCIVVTGSERAFAAGADISEMQPKTFAQVVGENMFGGADALARCRKPTIAAVAGFALGGGCELAMMADMIFAADTAKFGQPEIKLGVIPGIGGTQRLARAVGKAKAMDLCLTGRMMDAAEAEKSGLAARVIPADKLLEETLEAAKTIAGFSRLSVYACKDTVQRAFETTLAEGVQYERRAFQSLFATEDQKEGMAAFLEKRAPSFKHR